MDRRFYYDFDSEQSITGWKSSPLPGGCSSMGVLFKAPETAAYTFLFTPGLPPGRWSIKKFRAGRRSFNGNESSIAYVCPHAHGGIRSAFTLFLTEGVHPLELVVASSASGDESCFRASWIYSDPPVEAGAAAESRPRIVAPPPVRRSEDYEKKGEAGAADRKGFSPGVGAGSNKSAGRFGFTKGDGVLDCAMPMLGIIDKMYLCGHPGYKKPYKWTYSVIPPGTGPDSAFRGSSPPARAGIRGDRIEINHLSSRWEALLEAESGYFDRKAGEKVVYSCTYSLASPGILVETSDPGISLSMLEYAGNYRRLLVPGKRGVRSLDLGEEFVFDGDMEENWMLLCGAGEFPDIPVLIVFTRKPAGVFLRRNFLGRLTALDFHIPPSGAKAFVATPFGIESLLPAREEGEAGEEYFAGAARRCRFWSRAFLSFPVDCAEYYRHDASGGKVEILQEFAYRELDDEWNTPRLKTAVYPPVLSLLDGTGVVEKEPGARDFEFPTKYGNLQGVAGSSSASYKIPRMPAGRRFPLKDAGEKDISGLLAEGLEDYFDFHESFDTDRQAYPYAGAILEPFSWAAPMFNFMDGPAGERISKRLSERLALACSPDRRYAYPVISHGDMMRKMPGTAEVRKIYSDERMKCVRLHNWYERTEPFTGIKYRICYLHVGLLSGGSITGGTKEEISGLEFPMIENDWGAGQAFYYIYLAAQVSGDFSPVRENWKTLREGFDYFLKLHDWACMSTAYSESGTSWVEGANYGAFTGFVNLAEAAGDEDALARGKYIGAKQMVLRLAVLRSARKYFNSYFGGKPWMETKFFHEEASPGSAFQNVPVLLNDVYRPGSIYNIATEGLYPEPCSAFHEFLKHEFAELRDTALSSWGSEAPGENPWGAVQECSYCLISAALSDDYGEEEFLKELDKIESRGRLLGEWRGIRVFSRLLPRNYFKSQLLAWLAGRKHPVWLEFWVNIRILSAEYDGAESAAVIDYRLTEKSGLLRMGCRKRPVKAFLNGRIMEYRMMEGSFIEARVDRGGRMEIFFDG